MDCFAQSKSILVCAELHQKKRDYLKAGCFFPASPIYLCASRCKMLPVSNPNPPITIKGAVNEFGSVDI